MATIRYLIKKSKVNREGKSPLYVAIYHEDQTELIPTREYIKNSLWDAKNQRVKTLKNLPEDVLDIDSNIGKIKQVVDKIKRDLKSDSDVEPSAYDIKSAYDKKNEAKKIDKKEKEVKQKEDEKLLAVKIDKWISNLTYEQLTTKAIVNSFKKFKEFMGNKSEVKDLTEEKCNEYGQWLFKKKKLAKSSHGRHIKHLRWFIKSLKPRPFDFRDLKIHNSRKTIVALTLDELRVLEAFDVSSNPEFQKSKDMYLLGCYTGLRISDLRRISKACIHIDIQTGDKEIRLTTKKSKRDVEIPILPEAWEILIKYNQRAPKIAEQTVNTAIHTICKDAGFKKIITITETNGNIPVDKQYEKWEKISLHTSGKTFISLAEERWGLTIPQIASIVGKDIKTISAHYKSTDNMTAKEAMRKHNLISKQAVNE